MTTVSDEELQLSRVAKLALRVQGFFIYERDDRDG